MSDLTIAFGIVAAVLTVTALTSGVIERSPISFALLFLGVGIALDRFDVIDIDIHDPVLEVVATLTLSFVLFLDATRLQVEELGRRWVVPALVLGPGTALIIVLGALPLRVLFDFNWTLAFIGGAVLASTDPVLLRELMRDHRIPRSIRQVLQLEAGMNDLVVLPVLLILIAVAQSEVGNAGEWARFLLELLILGPAIGFAIGGVGAWAMSRMDRKMGIRNEYQALYGIGLVLAAYAAATAVDGDGFLSAFAAGLAVVLLNQSLCDCFLDYGEVTSEMAMLLAFVLFGAVLSGLLSDVDLAPALLLAALVVFAIRPAALSLTLSRAEMSGAARGFIAWFGPRGLNSLLLALLVVQAGVPGAELLLATIGVVVLVSAAVHGASAPLVAGLYARHAAARTLAEEREGTAAGLFAADAGTDEVPRITVEELARMLEEPVQPIVLDVRTRSNYEGAGTQIPGGVRVLPDQIAEWADNQQQRDRLVVAYCT